MWTNKAESTVILDDPLVLKVKKGCRSAQCCMLGRHLVCVVLTNPTCMGFILKCLPVCILSYTTKFCAVIKNGLIKLISLHVYMHV